MDAVEQWLRDNGFTTAADEWHDNPAVTTVAYDTPNPLADFLDQVEGPAMIGLDPVIYPACVVCSQAWMMRRTRGTWAWAPDCSHKNAHCKLVHA